MRSEFIVAGITALVVFVIYALTSAPGIGLVDSGELTAVAQTLGIAHPTGYPLYTLLGRVWLLVSRIESARGMVLFSCLMAAAGAGVIACIMLQWLNAKINRLRVPIMLAAGITALGFSLTRTAWSAIRYTEVYPLTFLLGALLLALAAKNTDEAKHESYLLILVGYLWGLGLGNHLTILWFFPVVFFALFCSLRKSTDPRKYVLFFMTAIAVGASVNLFLPIRSSVEPMLDWSDPQTLPNLVRHLTAWQYRIWMFKGSGAQFVHKLFSYLANVPADIGWGATAAVVLGLWLAVRRRLGYLRAALLTWAIGVIYNLNYDIPDIASYFLALYCPLFVVGAYGLAAGIKWIQVRFKSAALQTAGVLGLSALIPLTALASSLPAVTKGDSRFAERFTREILGTLPDSALVLQANWDIQSPAIFLQTVKHVRRDVVMLDINLMQRSWYIKQAQRAHPEVFAGLDRETNQFLREVAVFEARKPFDGKRIETTFLGMVNGVIARNMKCRPVYVRDMQTSRHPGIAASFPKSPGAFFLRIGEVADNEFTLSADNLMAGKSRYDDREAYLLREAALSVCLQGWQAMTKGNVALVQQTLKTARRLAPEDPVVLQFETAAREYLASAVPVQP